jgi:succinate dehydrogenase / fumarate reductase cytochrome b subunit
MQDRRPIFLNLFQIRFPVPAVMSFAHRVSGVLMVLLIPVLIWMLDISLASEQGFTQVRALLDHLVVRLALVLLAWGLLHHLFAGIRYLLLDLDIGIERAQGRVTAWLVLLGAAALAFAVAGWVLL